MTAEEALKVLDSFLKLEKLNNLQEDILRQSWQGETYQEIAVNSGYTDDYIREQGGKLWKLLSRAFDEKINKKNFKAVLEKQFRQEKTAILNDHRDWEEAIDVSLFCGRSEELTTLEQWIVKDKCRLVGLFGIGGIGKTSLAVKLARQTASKFDFVIWRSLRNAPSVDDLLAGIIRFLSQPEIEQNLPADTGSRISILITYLRSSRCLLVLDNGETILQSGTSCGRYREGYEGYGELFKRIGQVPHQSCLLLTSREKPQEFTILEGNSLPVRSFLVRGLKADTCQLICQLKSKFYGSPQNWQTLTHNYSGNPLVFKIVAGIVEDLFDGDIEQFMQQNTIAFDDLEDLLTEQFNRLSELEREIMYWLAIERQPVTFNQLKQDLLLSVSSKKLLEAVKSLKRRSLIEQTATGFTQQPVVMEYLIERQIAQVAAEIATQTPYL